jgi:integrase
MSVPFELAIELDRMDSTPARGVKALKIPKSRQRPHIPGTDEACALFGAEAIRPARSVVELGIGSVQRPSDLVGFTWGDYDGEALDLTQGKTDKRLWLPCSGPLKRALDEEIEILGGNPHPSAKIVRGERGQPLGYSGRAQMLRRERTRLGLLEHDQHALRYRAVMELARAGCSDAEIMACPGHDTRDMVKTYAGMARQRMRAKSAWEKRSRTEQG